MDSFAYDLHTEIVGMDADAQRTQTLNEKLDDILTDIGPWLETFMLEMNGYARLAETALTGLNILVALSLAAITIWRVRRFLHQRQQIETSLSWQASHDPLTGIANRRAFEDRLDKAAAHAADGGHYALIMIDLDQFKVVNDTCGHAAGDKLLRLLCGPLQAQLGPGDLLARLGGDEFSVLMPDCDLPRAIGIAESLRLAIQNLDFTWHDHVFRVTASIGVSHTDQQLVGSQDMMRAADMACFMAKEKGRNRAHVYSEEDEELKRRAGEMNWVHRIHQGLHEDRFCLYAQEIAPLAAPAEDGLHVELLVRLREDDGTLVPPILFLPAAERFGLMGLIDRWVVKSAFRLLAERGADPDAIPIVCCAINLSGSTIGDQDFLEFLARMFQTFDVAPSTICFEITETAAVSNLEAARSFVQELRALGCRFSLDDFGSGMSSFSYLKHFPVDFIKIDGCFVKNLLNDRIDRATVEAISKIGHVMGKSIIAEFVETEAHMVTLCDIGVDYGQGYGISRPQPFDLDFGRYKFQRPLLATA